MHLEGRISRIGILESNGNGRRGRTTSALRIANIRLAGRCIRGHSRRTLPDTCSSMSAKSGQRKLNRLLFSGFNSVKRVEGVLGETCPSRLVTRRHTTRMPTRPPGTAPLERTDGGRNHLANTESLITHSSLHEYETNGTVGGLRKRPFGGGREPEISKVLTLDHDHPKPVFLTGPHQKPTPVRPKGTFSADWLSFICLQTMSGEVDASRTPAGTKSPPCQPPPSTTNLK